MTLRDRVSERLLETGTNAFEAARRGNLGREFVNDILRGRKRTVRGDNLYKLATALDTTPEYLLGTDGSSSAMPEFPRVTADVEIAGSIAQDTWRKKDSTYARDRLKKILLLPPDARFPEEDQIDYLIEDSSIAEYAAPGSILRCLHADAWQLNYPPPFAYVLAKIEGDLYEYTVRTLKFGELGSTFKMDKQGFGSGRPTEIKHPYDRDDPPVTRTVAIVLYSYNPMLKLP